MIIATFIFYTLVVRSMNQHILNEVLKRGESVTNITALSVNQILLSGNFEEIDNTLLKLKNINDDIDYIAFIDITRKIISHTDLNKKGQRIRLAKFNQLKKNKDLIIHEKSDIFGNYFEFIKAINIKERHVGNIFVGLNKSLFTSIKHKTLKRLLIGFGAIVLVGIIGIIMLYTRITEPLKRLSMGMDKMKKELGINTVRIYSNYELERFTDEFNEISMLINLQKQNFINHTREMKEAYLSAVKVLASAIDARSPYTVGHSTRVSKLSMKLGEAIGLNEKELEELEITCLFHDIGKIRIPDNILNKREKLNSSEYREVINHPQKGAEILGMALSLQKYIPAVKYHHEWYNGEGYPEGLKKDRIPLFASIVTIADAFDSMTSHRPYRNALSELEAIKELINFSGKQFDPYLVEVFISILNKP